MGIIPDPEGTDPELLEGPETPVLLDVLPPLAPPPPETPEVLGGIGGPVEPTPLLVWEATGLGGIVDILNVTET